MRGGWADGNPCLIRKGGFGLIGAVNRTVIDTMKRIGLFLLLAASSASALTSPLATAYWHYGETPYPIIQSEGVLNIYTAVMIDEEYAPDGWGFFRIEGEQNIDAFRRALTNVNAAVTMMQRDKGIPGVMSAPIGMFSFRSWGQGGWVSGTNGVVESVGPVQTSILVRLGDDGTGNSVAFLEVTGTDGVPLKSSTDGSETRGMPIIPFGQGGTPNAADFAALLVPPAKEEETESAVAEDGE